jgi:LemA protein
MPTGVALGAILILLSVLVGVVVITIYNTVIGLQRRVDKAWANIDVALKLRHDELPSLVAAVRGQMGFERSVLDEVTRLRAAYSSAAPLPQQAETSALTSQALRSLFAVVERYPELTSQDNVLALQAEIQRVETVIARRRELFNEQVYQYNTTIRQIPAVLLAGVFGWQPRELFETSEPERLRPEVGLQPR